MITAADIMSDADVAELAGVSVDTFQRSLRVGIKAGELDWMQAKRETKGKAMKLDEMTHAQRAAFGRRLFGRIGLPHNIGTRLLLERIKEGRLMTRTHYIDVLDELDFRGGNK